jgi:hypothetical protein
MPMFLDGEPRLNDDATNTLNYVDAGELWLPMFARPGGQKARDLLKWTNEHALKNGYSHLLPVVRCIYDRYVAMRW